MHNLLVNSLNLKRVDLIHFRSNVHRNDPNNMKLRYRNTFLTRSEVPIHQLDTREVSLVDELVRFRDFDHPIEHPSSKLAIDLVVFKEIDLVDRHDLVLFDDVLSVELEKLLGD